MESGTRSIIGSRLPAMRPRDSLATMSRLSILFLAFFTIHAAATPADDLVTQGNEALRKMEVAAAMTAFTNALDIDPKHAEAAYQRGRILLKIGEPQKVIADFTTVIIAKPAYGRAYARRGEAKIVLKSNEEAFKDFDRAIEASPQDYEVYVVRATYLMKFGQVAGARADLQRAIEFADESTAASLSKMLNKLK